METKSVCERVQISTHMTMYMIVNISKMSFTSLYFHLGKSLALTIGPEKELLFLVSVSYSVDEVLILPDRS